MLKDNAPIYTVHDNFITTSAHSHKLPSIYSNAMKSLGSPLKIINKFIIMNLVQPLRINGIYCYIDPEMVIESELLKKILEANVPEDIVKSRRKVWDDRINTIMTSYQHYTTIICGEDLHLRPLESGMLHQLKYERFCKKMEMIKKVPLYSVHY